MAMGRARCGTVRLMNCDHGLDHVDPEDGVHGGHHEEGRDQEHPHDAPSGEIAVDQDGDCEAQYHGQNEDANDDEKAVLYSKPEVFVI